jgi:hypothetical protein
MAIAINSYTYTFEQLLSFRYLSTHVERHDLMELKSVDSKVRLDFKAGPVACTLKKFMSHSLTIQDGFSWTVSSAPPMVIYGPKVLPSLVMPSSRAWDTIS